MKDAQRVRRQSDQTERKERKTNLLLWDERELVDERDVEREVPERGRSVHRTRGCGTRKLEESAQRVDEEHRAVRRAHQSQSFRWRSLESLRTGAAVRGLRRFRPVWGAWDALPQTRAERIVEKRVEAIPVRGSEGGKEQRTVKKGLSAQHRRIPARALFPKLNRSLGLLAFAAKWHF